MDNRQSNQSISLAVSGGKLEIVRELINSCEQFYSRGYFLLRLALLNKHAAVAKLLLTNGFEVNGETRKPLNTPLHLAVLNGDLEIVNIILEKGANIEARNQSGQTPLHVAVEKGDTYAEVITLLLSRGANIDVQREDNITFLHIAAKNGYTRIAEILLSHGACIHSSTLMKGYTPLHFASELDNEEIVQLFLDRGADVNARTKDDSTPLHIAIKREREKIVRLLLQHGAKIDTKDGNGKTTLQLAVERGNSTIVDEILKCCPDINDLSNKSSLKIAVCSIGEEYEKIFEALLEYGFIVDPEIANDLHFLNGAVRKGYLKIVEDLLECGAVINASDEDGKTALHSTAESFAGDDSAEEIAKLLLSKGAYVDARTKESRTALYTAIRRGYAKLVEVLLDYGANVICGERSNGTALHVSAQEGNAKITRILLNRGANISAKRKDGCTALHIAAVGRHEGVVKVLLEYGVKVDAKRKDGYTSLHLCAVMNCPEIIETLSEFGANINARDEQGRTALHIASETGHTELVTTLLEHGSDINITSRNNNTPLDRAMSRIRGLAFRRPHGDNDRSFHLTQQFLISTNTAVFETLKHHIVKMKTANLYVSEKNLLLISNNDGISSFQDECEEEIARMKSEEINNTNVSFYDILANDKKSLARCIMNENIVQVLKSDNYKTKFPIYAGMIEKKFKKAMKKKELLEQSNESLHILFDNFFKLLPECVDKIINYFTDEDLRNLINACKRLGINNPNANDVVHSIKYIPSNVKVEEE